MAETPNDDLLVFAPESDEAADDISLPPAHPWKILIVDDDEEIHNVSRLVLDSLVFEGRPLALFYARSGAEGKELAEAHADAALMLLDVVMETDNAGLDVVRHVRDTLDNRFLRIVLRTGQPGQAPEKSVVLDYDINDYKEKTELTAQRLITTVVSALRAYRDIMIIENSRTGLIDIVEASRRLFERQSLAQFSRGILKQITSLLHLQENAFVLAHSAGFTARRSDTGKPAAGYYIVAGTGAFAEAQGKRLEDVAPRPLIERVADAMQRRGNIIDSHGFVGYFKTSSNTENIVCLQADCLLSDVDIKLLEVFSANIAIALDNLDLNDELSSTQRELIYTLSEVVETRSEETGWHARRVGEYSALLGSLAGLPEAECEVLRLVAPMHDLGKIGIPDATLQKPGKLTADEFEAMKAHAMIGYNVLKGSPHRQLGAAALIAQQHHERWDGSGYPQGLAGENIHLFGRIVALADVFDALAHTRSYKPAWPLEQVRDYIEENRGSHFDPQLTDLFLTHFDDFIAILRTYPD